VVVVVVFESPATNSKAVAPTSSSDAFGAINPEHRMHGEVAVERESADGRRRDRRDSGAAHGAHRAYLARGRRQ